MKFFFFDDDNCDCFFLLSLGYGMCYKDFLIGNGFVNWFGVDVLFDFCCNILSLSVGLILYFFIVKLVRIGF